MEKYMSICDKCGAELQIISRIRAECTNCKQRYIYLENGWTIDNEFLKEKSRLNQFKS